MVVGSMVPPCRARFRTLALVGNGIERVGYDADTGRESCVRARAWGGRPGPQAIHKMQNLRYALFLFLALSVLEKYGQCQVPQEGHHRKMEGLHSYYGKLKLTLIK
jgi:hypothetical protein